MVRGFFKSNPIKGKVIRGILLIGMALSLLILGARWVFFEGPYAVPDLKERAPIVDIHCHTAGIGSGGSGCFVSQELQSSYKFRIYLNSFGVDLPSLESSGDSLVIQRIAEQVKESKLVSAAVVLSMDGVVGEDGQLDRESTEFFVPNEFVLEETSKYPELFWGASINPKRTNAVELLTWAHANGAKLVKWLPSIQLFDPSDDAFVPFYQKLAELGLPLLSHAGQERSFSHARDELADPLKLKLALDSGVTVIVAHIASTGENEGERDTDRLLALMSKYPRLYSEISSLTQVNKLGYLSEALRDERFKGRLFYGSDYPLINSALVSPWYFSLNLDVQQMKELASVQNPWDRDVGLKQALGVPGEIFGRASRLIMTPEELQSIQPRDR
jgi:predicted TIM-barrel fold metal-dependent hydrolase